MISSTHPEATDDTTQNIPVECIRAGEGYKNMREELAAFVAMTVEEKERATRERSMGPGKMAKFIADFTRKSLIPSWKKYEND